MASNRESDEAVRLAMENTAMSMASRGKRVWGPARTEDSERIAALYLERQTLVPARVAYVAMLIVWACGLIQGIGIGLRWLS